MDANKLTDESMVMFCALTAIAAQLDRAQLAKDMRTTAAAMVAQCPDLAGSVAAVNSMADAFENVSAGLAGDLPKMYRTEGNAN